MAERKTIRLGSVVRTNVSTYSEKEGWSFVNYLDTGNITQDTISEIQRIMNENKIHSVLITDDDNHLLGIVDRYSCVL